MPSFQIYDRTGKLKGSGGGVSPPPPPPPLSVTGNAGLKLGGAALVHFPVALLGDAGVKLGGAGINRFPLVVFGDGGLKLGGGAVYNFPYRHVGDGGLELGGGADLTYAFQITGHAGLKLGGAAEFGDPVHWWRFSENTGTTAADTGSGTHVSAASIDGWTTTDLPTAPAGNVSAARLTNDGAAWNIPGDIIPDAAGDFTIMGRLRVSAINYTEVGFGSGVSGGFAIGHASGAFFWGFGTFASAPVGDLVADVWTHWAVTRNAATNELLLYIDAVQIDSDTATGDPTLASGYTAYNVTANPLTTDWIDVRVYNRVVPADEMVDIVGSPPPPPPPPPSLTDNFVEGVSWNGTPSGWVELSSHVPDSAGTWSNLSGGNAIITIFGGNEILTEPFSGGGGHYLVSWSPASADYTVGAHLLGTSGAGNTEIYLYARATDSTHFYRAFFEDRGSSTNNRLRIQLCNGGGVSDLATLDPATTGIVGASNKLLEFVLSGTSLKIFVDGVEFLATTDGTLSAGGQVGVGFTNSRVNSGIQMKDLTLSY